MQDIDRLEQIQQFLTDTGWAYLKALEQDWKTHVLDR
jgi:hypothetical protein